MLGGSAAGLHMRANAKPHPWSRLPVLPARQVKQLRPQIGHLIIAREARRTELLIVPDDESPRTNVALNGNGKINGHVVAAVQDELGSDIRTQATAEQLEAIFNASGSVPSTSYSNGNGNGSGSSNGYGIAYNSNGNGDARLDSVIGNGRVSTSVNGDGNGVPLKTGGNADYAGAVGLPSSGGSRSAANQTLVDTPRNPLLPPTPAATTTATGRAALPVVMVASSPLAAAVASSTASASAVAVPLAAPEASSPAAKRAARLSAAGTPYSAPGGKWANFQSYSTFQRTLQIWSFGLTFAFKYLMLSQKWTYGKPGMVEPFISARKSELAVWLREGLVRLGPTFIKIGQQFSTRVDVLAPEFIKELEVLQDNVPPFDTATAKAILTANLGVPAESVFEQFSEKPLAAASLGQVHLARLNGQPVVVKIQRPGLKALFDVDLANVRAIAVWLQKLDPKTDGAARDWVAIYDECSRILYQEIDYKLEGRNADLFRENFKNQNWIKVPKVFWEYSRSEVLVMEYCPGVKINDAAAIDRMGLDRKRLARLAVESYLQQILRHGFFHADPHPGNVAVDAVNGGRLIYYDYGMMGALDPNVKSGLLELFYGVYNKDPEKCLDALVTMGVYVPSGDKTAVKRTAEFFLAAFQDRLKQQKAEKETQGQAYTATYKPQRSKDESKARRKQILSSIGEDLLVASADQPFRFPATFTFVVRAFTVLDGIGKSLDPRFDITEIAAPYARELLLEGNPQVSLFGNIFKKGLQNQNRAVANLFKNPNKIEDVASSLLRLERGDVKLRVRALEAERALTRVQAWQRLIAAALAASTLVNIGTVLTVSALSAGATASFVGATFFAVMMAKHYLTIVKSEQRELQLTGAA